MSQQLEAFDNKNGIKKLKNKNGGLDVNDFITQTNAE
jgi:hypothetical protein